MPKPTLRNLVEAYFEPKWWQFWRRQQYHVCYDSALGEWFITTAPPKCPWAPDGHCGEHPRVRFAFVTDNVAPIQSLPNYSACKLCKVLLPLEPDFFEKLDAFLEEGGCPHSS